MGHIPDSHRTRFSVLVFLVALGEGLLWTSCANSVLHEQQKNPLDQTLLVRHANLMMLTGITPDSDSSDLEQRLANDTIKGQIDTLEKYFRYTESHQLQYDFQKTQPSLSQHPTTTNEIQDHAGHSQSRFAGQSGHSCLEGAAPSGLEKKKKNEAVVLAEVLLFTNGGVAIFSGAYAELISLLSATLCMMVWVSSESIPLFLSSTIGFSSQQQQQDDSSHDGTPSSDSDCVVPSSSVEPSPQSVHIASNSPVSSGLATPAPAVSPSEIQHQWQLHNKQLQQQYSPVLSQAKPRKPFEIIGMLTPSDIPCSLPQELQADFAAERQSFPTAPDLSSMEATDCAIGDSPLQGIAALRCITPATVADDWRQATKAKLSELLDKVHEEENHIASLYSLSRDVERYQGILRAQLQMLQSPESFDPEQIGLVEAALCQIQGLSLTVRNLEGAMEV